jgi:hypothetical protein
MARGGPVVTLLTLLLAPAVALRRQEVTLRLARWPLANGSAGGALHLEDSAIYRQELSNLNNVQYNGKILVGGQTFFGVMDTGSFDLLVLSTRCQNGQQACPAALKYDRSKSSTFREQGVRYEHCYVSGCATSELGLDTVKIGPLAAESQAFWQIVGHELPIINNAAFQAIVGLGIHDSPTLNMIHSTCTTGGARLESYGFVNASEGDASGLGVLVPGNGTADDFAKVDVKGKIAVVQRGNITFDTKVRNAEAAGATGCIIVNNVEGDPEGFTLGSKDDFLPCAAVRKSDGARLAGTSIRITTHELKHETVLQKLKMPEFAVCLEKGDKSPGWLIWGSQPGIHKQMASIEVIPNQPHWAANLSDISMLKSDGSSVQLDACKPWCAAIIDSGTSFLTVPKDTLEKIRATVGEVPLNCQGIDALPTLRFRLGDSTFELPPRTYVVRIRVPQAKGITPRLSVPSGGLLAQAPEQVVCVLAFQSTDAFEEEDGDPAEEQSAAGHIWILGMPWLRHYYTVFDRAERRMLATPAAAGC